MDAGLHVTVFPKNPDFNPEAFTGPGICSNTPNQSPGSRMLNFGPRSVYARSFRLLGADVPNFLGIPQRIDKTSRPLLRQAVVPSWTP